MPCKVAIVGACSLAGREILKTLSDRSFPLSQVRLFDTEFSVGHRVSYDNADILVEEISEHVLREEKFRFVFFTGGYNLSKDFLSFAKNAGSKVIDVSSYAYTHENAPLVIPQIDFTNFKETAVFANPMCLAIHLSLVLQPILAKTLIQRIVASTYQAASGAGFLGVEELERQTEEIENGKEATVNFFPKQLAFNVFPQVCDMHVGAVWSKEEISVEKEVQDILQNKDLDIALTCVRVPVIRCHSISIMMELDMELSVEDLHDLWEKQGLQVYKEGYPTPWDLEGTIDVGIGRLRQDKKRKNCYYFWTVADNLSVGTALNAVQIAEEFV